MKNDPQRLQRLQQTLQPDPNGHPGRSIREIEEPLDNPIYSSKDFPGSLDHSEHSEKHSSNKHIITLKRIAMMLLR